MPNWREDEDDKKLKLLFEPNTQYGYSGEAYQYLAMVLKEISRTDWKGLEKLFQQKVAIPLKMEHTVFIQNDYTRKNKAEPYDENGKWIDWKNNYWFKKEDNIFYAASSIHTEPIDFSKWMLAIMDNKGLSNKSFEIMLKPYSDVPVDELNIKYTLGFNKLDYPFTNIFFHGGDNEGFNSLFVFDKSKKWGFVLFANSENGRELGKDLFFYLLTDPNKTNLYISLIIGILVVLIVLFSSIRYFIKIIKKHMIS
jgi:CubicO group peptidase (beta-lactamase class C family)